MKILAVDTSTEYCSVALLEDLELIEEINDKSKHSHNRKLFKNIDIILKNSKLSFKDVDLLGIGSGPGSFTGLRVGLSAMKGIALASGIKLIPVRSIDAVAYQGLIEKNTSEISVLLEAKQQDMFKAYYNFTDGKINMLSGIDIINYNEKIENRYISVGNVSKEIVKIKDYYDDFFPSAYYIGKIAYGMNDVFKDDIEITPEYYKDFKINKSKKKPLIDPAIS